MLRTKKFETFVFAPMTLILLSACGEKSRPEYPDAATIEKPAHWQPVGSLGESLKELRAEKQWLEECDLKQTEAQNILVDALDKNAEAIKKYTAESMGAGQQISAGHTPHQSGPFMFLLRDGNFVAAPAIRENISAPSWAELLESYNKIKDTPMSLEWRTLNSSVRSIVDNDYSRIYYGDNMYLSRADKKLLPEFTRLLEEAVTSGSDFEEFKASLSDELKPLLKNDIYAWYINRWRNPSHPEYSKDMPQRFLEKRIRRDLRASIFRKNESIRSDSTNKTLVLPLTAKDFLPIKDEMKQFIEKGWSLHGLTLQVEWTEDLLENLAKTFTLNVIPTAGTRSYVSYTEKEVHLVQPLYIGTLWHEMGHVLGFRDNYHTTWNYETCKYSDELFDADLMSSSRYGNVLSDHMAEIERAYFPVTE